MHVVATSSEALLAAALARAHRMEVGGLVARALLDEAATPDSVALAARTLYSRNVARNLYLEAETARWVEAFAAGGIRSVPIKGVRASRDLHGDPGVKACADVDLLVRRSDWERAIEVAAERGFVPRATRPSIQPSETIARTLWAEGAPKPYSLDLHRDLENPRVARLDAAALWRAIGDGDSLPVTYAGVLAVLHAWRHAFTLKALADLAAFIARHERSLPEVRSILRGASFGAGFSMALDLSERVLDVRSRHRPGWYARRLLVGPMTACVAAPAVERGHYLHWLFIALPHDGVIRGPLRAIRHLFRADPLSSGSGLGARARRLAGGLGRFMNSKVPFIGRRITDDTGSRSVARG